MSWFRDKLYKYVRIPLSGFLFKKFIKIKNTEDTINYIIENRCSIARYGDGEFNIMFGGRQGFQRPDKELGSKLSMVLRSKLPNLIIGIPYAFVNTDNFIPRSVMFWNYYRAINFIFLLRHLDFTIQYYDSLMSRFYMDYEDKSNCEHILFLLKKIWNERNIIIIEGDQSRTGVGNDLFYNANSIKRILCPSENAFDKYDEILSAARNLGTKDHLFILSLGMTATVLAYDLAKDGYQAVDLGHLDVEYEWYKLKATKKIPLQNRYVNEANAIYGKQNVENCMDKEYLSEIIATIK